MLSFQINFKPHRYSIRTEASLSMLCPVQHITGNSLPSSMYSVLSVYRGCYFLRKKPNKPQYVRAETVQCSAYFVDVLYAISGFDIFDATHSKPLIITMFIFQMFTSITTHELHLILELLVIFVYYYPSSCLKVDAIVRRCQYRH